MDFKLAENSYLSIKNFAKKKANSYLEFALELSQLLSSHV